MAFPNPANGPPFKQRSGSIQGQNSNPAPSAFPDRFSHLNRGPTPDSEAVASSDDDHDSNSRLSQSAQLVKQTGTVPAPAPRRPSWLSEVASNSNAQRKKSLSGLGRTDSFEGPSTQPVSPFANVNPFGNTNPFSSTGRGLNKPSTLSSSAMVAPSPTTANFDDLRSPMALGHVGYGGIGVPIPSEPLRKSVRSQSYSAGQSEESGISNVGRLRNGPTHRASRSTLRENGLQSLREQDDDGEGDDEFDGTGSSSMFPSNYNLSNPSSTFGLPARRGTMPARMVNRPADYDEEDDETTPRNASLSNGSGFGALGRSNTFSIGPYGSSEDQSQSRRHSLANLPRPRNGSVVRVSDNMVSDLHNQLATVGLHDLHDGFPTGSAPLAAQSMTTTLNGQYRDHSPLSYANNSNAANPAGIINPNALMQTRSHEQTQMEANTSDRSFAASYFSNGAVDLNRPFHDQAQEQGENFNIPQPFGPRPGRSLYIVTFKCSRAEIYYVADNMGLQLKQGDMVICEGDRGTDLGTIENMNVTMEEAKRLKQEFNKRHFRNLMMFSRAYPHMAALANDDEQLSRFFGTTSSPGGVLDPSNSGNPDPRPKAIKRIANGDEVRQLRDKEGNEAKAKRMCQNKTYEHGLRMEILDAEFQHDYKKLTFFYYAEEYINFNELVTDLFKIYKTRIWMSAINQAAHPQMNPHHAMRPPPQARAAPSPYQPQLQPQQLPYQQQASPYQQQHQYGRLWGPPGPYNQPIPFVNY